MNEPGWRIRLAPSARRDIKRLDPHVRERILAALDGWKRNRQPGTSSASRATRPSDGYAFGDWRVRFDREPEESVVVVQRVLPRGRAYRD